MGANVVHAGHYPLSLQIEMIECGQYVPMPAWGLLPLRTIRLICSHAAQILIMKFNLPHLTT
jgi:hypothetical protein